MTTTHDDFESVEIFIAHAGPVHLAAIYSWGYGALCSKRYLEGERDLGTRGQVTCTTCIPGTD